MTDAAPSGGPRRGVEGLVLGPWAAQSCPVKTQNAHDPRIVGEQPRPVPDEALRELFAGTEEWRTQVSDALAGLEGAVDLRGDDGPPGRRAARTLEALRAGVPVLLGAELPRDLRGHRYGRCDVLVRGADAAPGRPGYAPVQVKGHKVREPRAVPPEATLLRVSGLDAPAWEAGEELPGWSFRNARRESDVLQLAHFWRMLQACGHAADGEPVGGVVGTDDPTAVTWIRLHEPRFRTFSRRAEGGWRLRSGLERYDHEHQFRVSVASRAERLGEPGVEPMVQPIRVSECDRCQWWEHCRPQLDAEDISLRIAKAPLDVREISVLRSLGVSTTRALAGADLEELLPRYLPEVAHRAQAERRLRVTARRAQLISDGVLLERLESGPVDVPAAEVEVDLDIETSAEDRVYLWGFLVGDTVTGSSTFESFVAWDDLDAAGELELAGRALSWLRELAEGPRTTLVFHYSDYETVRIGQLAERAASEGHPAAEVLAWARDEGARQFVDLFATVRDHLFGVHGLGLKVVASTGAGFAWRDVDPGGLNSQRWFAEAVHGSSAEMRETARTRVLEYNEDDVQATAAVRRWLRSMA
ncbi:TM0106 family RecB-like putative nuclease [Auraticoccus monumenti]|uniref:RecB family nuclease, putative, TM0106 family n=1 Tax=Auraticoccus monumenti TaxID=675864 RepID=A0A1G6WTV5_9ACTN|nr:TM0106 family RecB-like putative nuclease [Auraticoccus monumenti]SDD68516.1 RecB family nuclease, putative, TM0106 family [Auraticoccus monumenti]